MADAAGGAPLEAPEPHSVVWANARLGSLGAPKWEYAYVLLPAEDLSEEQRRRRSGDSVATLFASPPLRASERLNWAPPSSLRSGDWTPRAAHLGRQLAAAQRTREAVRAAVQTIQLQPLITELWNRIDQLPWSAFTGLASKPTFWKLYHQRLLECNSYGCFLELLLQLPPVVRDELRGDDCSRFCEEVKELSVAPVVTFDSACVSLRRLLRKNPGKGRGPWQVIRWLKAEACWKKDSGSYDAAEWAACMAQVDAPVPPPQPEPAAAASKRPRRTAAQYSEPLHPPKAPRLAAAAPAHARGAGRPARAAPVQAAEEEEELEEQEEQEDQQEPRSVLLVSAHYDEEAAQQADSILADLAQQHVPGAPLPCREDLTKMMRGLPQIVAAALHDKIAGGSPQQQPAGAVQQRASPRCALCHTQMDGRGETELGAAVAVCCGRLSSCCDCAASPGAVVHRECAFFSHQVCQDEDGTFIVVARGRRLAGGLHSEVRRGSKLSCKLPACRQRGATLGCTVAKCREVYHYPCALQAGCQFEPPGFSSTNIACVKHSSSAAASAPPLRLPSTSAAAAAAAAAAPLGLELSSPIEGTRERCRRADLTAAGEAAQQLAAAPGGAPLVVLCPDLSRQWGDAEALPVPVLAPATGHPMPPPFRYITRRTGTERVAGKDWRQYSSGCNCSHAGCGAGDTPASCCEHVVERDLEYPLEMDLNGDPMEGRLSYSLTALGECQLTTATNTPLHECNDRCSCGPACSMRVLQRGLRLRLAVMPSPGRGWGVFAGQLIPRGSFVIQYVGHLITEEEAGRLCDADEYLFDIDQHRVGLVAASSPPVAVFTVNAHQAGNVSRFINHSCEPNVHVRAVFWESDDPRLAHLALFALRDIQVGQELQYDYGYAVDEALPKVPCNCGAARCRKWLRNVPGTGARLTPVKLARGLAPRPSAGGAAPMESDEDEDEEKELDQGAARVPARRLGNGGSFSRRLWSAEEDEILQREVAQHPECEATAFQAAADALQRTHDMCRKRHARMVESGRASRAARSAVLLEADEY